MVRASLLVVLLAFTTAVQGLTPKIVFERVVPAAADLGPVEDVAIVAAADGGEPLETFVGSFVRQVNQSRTLRAYDLRRAGGRADARLEVSAFSCTTTSREGEGSGRDSGGNRIRQKRVWVDASCTAALTVISPKSNSLREFTVRSDGTSPRVDQLTADESAAALRQAARYAGVEAAERVTPRRVREAIALEEDAAGFDEGMAMIEAQQLKEARAIWEKRLRHSPGDAALHFNLGALCEALGDRTAAERHYATARDLAPDRERYARELRMFNARN